MEMVSNKSAEDDEGKTYRRACDARGRCTLEDDTCHGIVSP